jgi:Raf kinase inhibitor-like YbhB/YbcL family protein
VTYSPQPAIMPTALRRMRRIWPGLGHAFRSTLLSLAFGALVSGSIARAEAAPTRFTLRSSTVHTGTSMPSANVGARGNCNGENKSPPLAWNHAPEGTASFAVTMADLDAKVGVVWLWLMFNIPATVTSLVENAAGDLKLKPTGASQARNGFDVVGYLGPCPKKGSIPHQYLITVWALNEVQLPFKDGAPSQAVAIYLRSHALGHASLTPHYGVH